LKGLF